MNIKRYGLDESLAIELRIAVAKFLVAENIGIANIRKVSKGTAFQVVERSLASTQGLPDEVREFRALKELSEFSALARSNKVVGAYAKHTDLLPIAHPASTRRHSLTASALVHARLRWLYSENPPSDLLTIVASASRNYSETEVKYITTRIAAAGYGEEVLQVIVAAANPYAGKNSRLERSLRARLQRRDRKGRFAWMGGSMRALVRRADGVYWFRGRTVGVPADSETFELETPDGRIARIPAARAEGIEAFIGMKDSQDGFSPNPINVPATESDFIVDESEIQFMDAPTGWKAWGDAVTNDDGSVSQRFLDDAEEIAVARTVSQDGSRRFDIMERQENGEFVRVGETDSWAGIDDFIDENTSEEDKQAVLAKILEENPDLATSDELKDLLAGRATAEQAPNVQDELQGLIDDPNFDFHSVAQKALDFIKEGLLPTDEDTPDTIKNSLDRIANALEEDGKSDAAKTFRDAIDAVDKRVETWRTETPAPAEAPAAEAPQFDVPDKAYELDPANFVPEGRTTQESEDFTDDPVELSTKFTEEALRTALSEALSPVEGDDATGLGRLEFDAGAEQVPAEALYLALEKQGADAESIANDIYDEIRTFGGAVVPEDQQAPADEIPAEPEAPAAPAAPEAKPERRQTGIFREYAPDNALDGAENTPLSELGFDPEKEITVYRGVPKGVDKINPGDWVTALPQLARDYAGEDGDVVSMKVKAKDLLADPSVGEGAYTEEMVYRPVEEAPTPEPTPEVAPAPEAPVAEEAPATPRVEPEPAALTFNKERFLRRLGFLSRGMYQYANDGSLPEADSSRLSLLQESLDLFTEGLSSGALSQREVSRGLKAIRVDLKKRSNWTKDDDLVDDTRDFLIDELDSLIEDIVLPASAPQRAEAPAAPEPTPAAETPAAPEVPEAPAAPEAEAPSIEIPAEEGIPSDWATTPRVLPDGRVYDRIDIEPVPGRDFVPGPSGLSRDGDWEFILNENAGPGQPMGRWVLSEQGRRKDAENIRRIENAVLPEEPLAPSRTVEERTIEIPESVIPARQVRATIETVVKEDGIVETTITVDGSQYTIITRPPRDGNAVDVVATGPSGVETVVGTYSNEDDAADAALTLSTDIANRRARAESIRRGLDGRIDADSFTSPLPDNSGAEDNLPDTTPPAQISQISPAARDLMPGDVTVRDGFTITEVGTERDSRGKISVKGFFPGHPVQEKLWNHSTPIEVFRGIPEDQMPRQGNLPEIHQPQARDFEGGSQSEEFRQAYAEWLGNIEAARARWVGRPVSASDPMNRADVPHRATVFGSQLRPGDITADPNKGHFVITRVFIDDETKEDFVSIEGYYPGHQTQRKEWKQSTVFDVFRNVDAPASGDLEPFHQPFIINRNGNWQADTSDEEGNRIYRENLAAAAARFDAPTDLPSVDLLSNTDDLSTSPVAFPTTKPKLPYAPGSPLAQGEFENILREANGDPARLAELLKDRELIFFDYETTGFDKRNDGVWQLGAVKVVNGEVVEEFNVFMNPETSVSRVMESAPWLNLRDADGNPVTDEFLSQQMSMADGHRQFLEFAGENPLLVAQNVSFDRGFLERILGDNNISMQPAGFLDTLALAKGLHGAMPSADRPKGQKRDKETGELVFNANGTPRMVDSNSLGDVARYYGVDIEHHRADADARATAGVLFKMLDKMSETQLGLDTLNVDLMNANLERDNQRYARDMAFYNRQNAAWEMGQAIQRASNGEPVSADDVIIAANESEVADAIEVNAENIGGSQAEPPSPTTFDVPVNDVFTDGRMRLVDRAWIENNANAREMDPEDVRMSDLTLGDFMTSRDGSVMFQVVGTQRGSEFGVDEGYVRVFRANVADGQISSIEYRQNTRMHGVRRALDVETLRPVDGDRVVDAEETVTQEVVPATVDHAMSDDNNLTSTSSITDNGDGTFTVNTTVYYDREGGVLGTNSETVESYDEAVRAGQQFSDSMDNAMSEATAMIAESVQEEERRTQARGPVSDAPSAADTLSAEWDALGETVDIVEADSARADEILTEEFLAGGGELEDPGFIEPGTPVNGRIILGAALVDHAPEVTAADGRKFSVTTKLNERFDGAPEIYSVVVRSADNPDIIMHTANVSTIDEARAAHDAVVGGLERGSIIPNTDPNFGRDINDITEGDSSPFTTSELLPGAPPERMRIIGGNEFNDWQNENFIYADGKNQARIGDRVVHSYDGWNTRGEGVILDWEIIENPGDRQRIGYALVAFADGSYAIWSTRMLFLNSRGTSSMSSASVRPPEITAPRPEPRPTGNRILALTNKYEIKKMANGQVRVVPYVSINQRTWRAETQRAYQLWQERKARIDAYRRANGLPIDAYREASFQIPTNDPKKPPIWRRAIVDQGLFTDSTANVGARRGRSATPSRETATVPPTSEARPARRFPNVTTPPPPPAPPTSAPEAPSVPTMSATEADAVVVSGTNLNTPEGIEVLRAKVQNMYANDRSYIGTLTNRTRISSEAGTDRRGNNYVDVLYPHSDRDRTFISRITQDKNDPEKLMVTTYVRKNDGSNFMQVGDPILESASNRGQDGMFNLAMRQLTDAAYGRISASQVRNDNGVSGIFDMNDAQRILGELLGNDDRFTFSIDNGVITLGAEGETPDTISSTDPNNPNSYTITTETRTYGNLSLSEAIRQTLHKAAVNAQALDLYLPHLLSTQTGRDRIVEGLSVSLAEFPGFDRENIVRTSPKAGMEVNISENSLRNNYSVRVVAVSTDNASTGVQVHITSTDKSNGRTTTHANEMFVSLQDGLEFVHSTMPDIMTRAGELSREQIQQLAEVREALTLIPSPTPRRSVAQRIFDRAADAIDAMGNRFYSGKPANMTEKPGTVPTAHPALGGSGEPLSQADLVSMGWHPKRAAEIARAAQYRPSMSRLKELLDEFQSISGRNTRKNELADEITKTIREIWGSGHKIGKWTIGDVRVSIPSSGYSFSVVVPVLDENGRLHSEANRQFSVGSNGELSIYNASFFHQRGGEPGGFAGVYNDYMVSWLAANDLNNPYVKVSAAGGGDSTGGANGAYVWGITGFNFETARDAVSRLQYMSNPTNQRTYGATPEDVAHVDSMLERARVSLGYDSVSAMLSANSSGRIMGAPPAGFPTPAEMGFVGWNPVLDASRQEWFGMRIMRSAGWAGKKRISPSSPERLAEYAREDAKISREMVTAGKNKVSVTKWMSDHFKSPQSYEGEEAYLGEYANEILDVFGIQGVEKSVSLMSPQARMALGKHASRLLSSGSYMERGDSEEVKQRNKDAASSLASIVNALGEDQFNRFKAPELSERAVAARALSVSDIEKITATVATDLVIDGKDTGFVASVETVTPEGVPSGWRLIDKGSGETIHIKKNDNAQTSSSEVQSSALARALGISGSPIVDYMDESKLFTIGSDAGSILSTAPISSPDSANPYVSRLSHMEEANPSNMSMDNLFGMFVLDALTANPERNPASVLLLKNHTLSGMPTEETWTSVPVNHTASPLMRGSTTNAEDVTSPLDFFSSLTFEQVSVDMAKTMYQTMGPVAFKAMMDAKVQKALNNLRSQFGSYMNQNTLDILELRARQMLDYTPDQWSSALR